MKFVETLDDLHALYGTPGAASLTKVANRMTPEYRACPPPGRYYRR